MTTAVGNSARANVWCGSATAISRLMPSTARQTKKFLWQFRQTANLNGAGHWSAAGPPTTDQSAARIAVVIVDR
jgi:hypothetical protein